MSTSYTTYLFDFDYTLADSSRGIVICFRNVLEQNGFHGIEDDAIKRTIGQTLEEAFRLLTGVKEEEQLIRLRREYGAEADVHMKANTSFFPDALSVLQALKRRGARMGIISTKYRFRIAEFLEDWLPEDFFDIIVGIEDVQAAKPSPEGLLQALKRLGSAPQETLYIGDSVIDAETAQRAGVDFAGILYGATTAGELRGYPHRMLMENLGCLLRL